MRRTGPANRFCSSRLNAKNQKDTAQTAVYRHAKIRKIQIVSILINNIIDIPAMIGGIRAGVMERRFFAHSFISRPTTLLAYQIWKILFARNIPMQVPAAAPISPYRLHRGMLIRRFRNATRVKTVVLVLWRDFARAI